MAAMRRQGRCELVFEVAGVEDMKKKHGREFCRSLHTVYSQGDHPMACSLPFAQLVPCSTFIYHIISQLSAGSINIYYRERHA